MTNFVAHGFSCETNGHSRFTSPSFSKLLSIKSKYIYIIHPDLGGYVVGGSLCCANMQRECRVECSLTKPVQDRPPHGNSLGWYLLCQERRQKTLQLVSNTEAIELAHHDDCFVRGFHSIEMSDGPVVGKRSFVPELDGPIPAARHVSTDAWPLDVDHLHRTKQYGSFSTIRLAW